MQPHNPQPLPSQPSERDDRRAEVEAVARAICLGDGMSPDKLSHNSFEWWRHYVPHVRAAIRYFDTLTADRDRLKARVEELHRALDHLVVACFQYTGEDQQGYVDSAFDDAVKALKGEHA